MQIGEQRVFFGIVEAQLLREDQRAARQQRLANAREQRRALIGGDELQGEVQRHHRGGLEVEGENVAFDHFDRQQLLEHRVLTVEVFAAALNHRCRVIHSDYPATVGAHVATQGLSDSAQGRAEVVEHAVRLGELRGEHAEVFDDGRVTRHRALDHVREHPHHVFIEGEVGHLGQRLGENTIGFFAHGGSGGVNGKAGILAKRARGCLGCLIKRFFAGDRSHALRGNAAPDAPRPCANDAERHRMHSHAERGNDQIRLVWEKAEAAMPHWPSQ
ncbi:hypothetical protein D3C87_1206150 [compost metagenome]